MKLFQRTRVPQSHYYLTVLLMMLKSTSLSYELLYANWERLGSQCQVKRAVSSICACKDVELDVHFFWTPMCKLRTQARYPLKCLLCVRSVIHTYIGMREKWELWQSLKLRLRQWHNVTIAASGTESAWAVNKKLRERELHLSFLHAIKTWMNEIGRYSISVNSTVEALGLVDEITLSAQDSLILFICHCVWHFVIELNAIFRAKIYKVSSYWIQTL